MLGPVTPRASLSPLLRRLLITAAKEKRPRTYGLKFDASIPTTELSKVTDQLKGIPGIKAITLTNTGGSLRLRSDSYWPSVKQQVERVLYERFDPDTPHTPEELQAAIAQIQKTSTGLHAIELAAALLLRAAINPYLARDGGSCTLHSVENTPKGVVVHLNLHGNCSGCPSSSQTMKGFVIKQFKKYLPTVTDVVAHDA
ncbi:Nfu [Giardia muris]|uniref:Nfu n=1 Tax=Giardia muris TaxID=5742 RepID=A0A4Z1T3D4_GIAMU|nr:Nfu [Giardia muris]|eukprot:TNJ26911.1 Nfu [Giardia muris]